MDFNDERSVRLFVESDTDIATIPRLKPYRAVAIATAKKEKQMQPYDERDCHDYGH